MGNQTYLTEIFTGLRPSNNLTVANAIGSVLPVVNLLNGKDRPLIFVADLHGLTDNELSTTSNYTHELVKDFVGLGYDPSKGDIYLQSDIKEQILELTLYLARLMSVSEIVRVPTLKDKLKATQEPEQANVLLALYPIMMAADILSVRAKHVPVGEDQTSHLEVCRLLVERFNKRYGDVFGKPQPLAQKSIKILSLNGNSKMSKSIPEGAIFLTDTAEEIAKKVKRAETDVAGQMNPILESHFLLADSIASEHQKARVSQIQTRHLGGENVMKEFKGELTAILQDFNKKFAKNREGVSDSDVQAILATGKKIAEARANNTLELVRSAMSLQK